MLKTLKLVRGAVADKDLVPVLTHFHIHDGRIQGGNGRVTIDAPCPELAELNITVPADRFLKAVDGCDGGPNLNVTEAGALMVKKGGFKVRLPLSPQDDFPRIEQEPGEEPIPVKDLLPILQRLRPFIGEDASRPWLCAVAVMDGYAYATNNPVMVRVPAGDLPFMTIPVFAVDELLRMRLEPESVTVTETGLLFHLPGGTWLQCRSLAGEWPDVGEYFEEHGNYPMVPSGLKAAVEKILPFCPDLKFPEVHLGPEGISTADGAMSAIVETTDLPESRWHAKNLLLILSEATEIDFSTWPAPCRWSGVGGLQGVAVGLSS